MGEPEHPVTPRSAPPWGSAPWLWVGGVAAVILAARLGEIGAFTGDVGINDQWKIEAADLYAPWLNGALRPWDFLRPHFEHLPAWSRLLAWLEVALTGRWDPFLQATVNSLCYAGWAALILRWLQRTLPLLAAVAVSALVAAAGILPHAWENTTWGFQSQFPLALLFLFLHADGSFRHAPGGAGWWRAQAAGVAGLLTLAGMWLAPIAVVLVSLWTQPRGPRIRLWPLATAAVGLAIIAAIRAVAPPGGAFAQTAGSPLHFLHSLLDLLGWPAGWPGALMVVNLPLIALLLRQRGRADTAAFDRTTLALGLWSWGQAAALAYARSADYSGYVSRYGDLLAVGLLANAAALARLLPSLRRWRVFGWAFAFLWSVVAVAGLNRIATTGHSAYFHENSMRDAAIRREAVQAYVFRHDRRKLEDPETRWRLYQDVDQVTSLLDQPAFRALLPTTVLAENPPVWSGRLVRAWQEQWRGFAVLGGLTALTGLLLCFRTWPGSTVAALTPAPVRGLRWLAAGAALGAFGLLHCWPSPYLFDASGRWWRLARPSGSVGPLEYAFEGAAPVPVERLAGAAPLDPDELRRLFCGTAPEGPGLTGTVLSSRFTINSPYFVVPYAGYPIGHGNGLRIRIERPDGRTLTEVACPGPNSTDLAFWVADVRAYAGQPARLVLYDGRTETEAWVAAAPPIATSDPALAGRLSGRYALEKLAPAHAALGLIALASVLLLLATFLPAESVRQTG